MTTITPTPNGARFKSGGSRYGDFRTMDVAGWDDGPGVIGAVTDGHLRTRPA